MHFTNLDDTPMFRQQVHSKFFILRSDEANAAVFMHTFFNSLPILSLQFIFVLIVKIVEDAKL